MIYRISKLKSFKISNLISWNKNWEYWVRNEYIHNGVKEYLKSKLLDVKKEKGKLDILDVGCGSSWVSNEYKDIFDTYLGVDFNEKLISFLNKERSFEKIKYLYQDVTSSFTLKKKYNLIIANFLLLELEDLNSFFNNIKKQQNSGDYLMIFGLSSFYEIFRDSRGYNEFIDNVKLYRNDDKAKIVIEKKMLFNNLKNDNSYYRILHSLSTIANLSIKHGYSVEFIEDELNRKSDDISQPVYYFIKLKKR